MLTEMRFKGNYLYFKIKFVRMLNKFRDWILFPHIKIRGKPLLHTVKIRLLQGSETSETRLLQEERGSHHRNTQLSVRLVFRASSGLFVPSTTVLHIRQRWE